MSEFVCALTGEEAETQDIVDGDADFDGMPLGWTRVTIERRTMNPRLMEIMQAKRMLVQAALSQMPEEARASMAPLVALQIDAQFASLVDLTPEHAVERDVVYISDPADNTVLEREWNAMRDSLGLDAVEIERDEDNTEDEEEEG